MNIADSLLIGVFYTKTAAITAIRSVIRTFYALKLALMLLLRTISPSPASLAAPPAALLVLLHPGQIVPTIAQTYAIARVISDIR